MNKKLLFLAFTVTFMGNAYCQDDSLKVSPTENQIFTDNLYSLPDPKVTFDFDIRAAFTSGEFKQFYPKDGMGGMGATVLFPINKRNPLDVGFGLGYYFMSHTSSDFQYYSPGVGDYNIESTVSGSMFPFHLVARAYPLKSVRSPVQPYVEGLAGFRLFIVDQEINTFIDNTGVELPPQTETNTTGSWSYGFGAGVKVRISKKNLLYLNAKVDQLYGTETDYMDPTTINLYDDGSYEYVNQRSETDVLRFSIGLHLMLE